MRWVMRAMCGHLSIQKQRRCKAFTSLAGGSVAIVQNLRSTGKLPDEALVILFDEYAPFPHLISANGYARLEEQRRSRVLLCSGFPKRWADRSWSAEVLAW